MVNDAIITIQRTAHKLAFEAWQYLQRWRKYSTLWSFDKNLAAEKYAATQPTLHQYDEKFSFYSNILDEVMEMNSSYNLYSIRFVTNWGVISLYLIPILSSSCPLSRGVSASVASTRSVISVCVGGLRAFLKIASSDSLKF